MFYHHLLVRTLHYYWLATNLRLGSRAGADGGTLVVLLLLLAVVGDIRGGLGVKSFRVIAARVLLVLVLMAPFLVVI